MISRPYQLMIVAFCLLTPILAIEVRTQNRQWLSYEPAVVELEGELTVEPKYGPPNYGENPKTDAKVRVPILRLSTSVNVRGTPGDGFNANSVREAKRIQLLFRPGASYDQFIGKKVRVKGTLFHAFSGHHYTKVVMDVRVINDASEK
ncbi:MAG TPA: DUF4431 domain-containing protein [Pyrinomonadaceae bacterium]|nr:DUF4431 domain-containing protein [Pyrinomonadaceae bacterium]